MNRQIIIAFLFGTAMGIVMMILGTGSLVHAQGPTHESYSISAASNSVYVVSTKGSIVYCGTTTGSCVLLRGNQY